MSVPLIFLVPAACVDIVLVQHLLCAYDVKRTDGSILKEEKTQNINERQFSIVVSHLGSIAEHE